MKISKINATGKSTTIENQREVSAKAVQRSGSCGRFCTASSTCMAFNMVDSMTNTVMNGVMIRFKQEPHCAWIWWNVIFLRKILASQLRRVNRSSPYWYRGETQSSGRSVKGVMNVVNLSNVMGSSQLPAGINLNSGPVALWKSLSNWMRNEYVRIKPAAARNNSLSATSTYSQKARVNI